ncbi:unnamed protein product [Paramecium pentaurelia]|uniref:RING-type domain-containing protein n=1 Tax=Paramecium pentaurelia TaxID=43138 RepID=A0A8S1VI35_9CILI|nr:unnamed protein product [Paramecium pentaurelia]
MIILIIIFLICNAYHHQGTLQINHTLSLKTNITQNAQSIIIKFILPLHRNRDQTVACFVSNFDLESQILNIQDLKLKNENDIVYDLHSIQSNSNTQLIEYFLLNTIYLYCQSQAISQIQYLLIYKEDTYKPSCINDCQGYNHTKFISKSYCLNNHCECQTNQIGFFCQLSSSYILSSTPQEVILDSFQWKFFYYQYNNIMDLLLLCNLSIEDKSVLYSITFRQIPQLEIPNLSISKVLVNGTSLQMELSKLIENSNGSKIFYIGLYNNKSQQQQLKITIVSNESLDYEQLERNKIIIITVGTIIGVILLITCILSYIKSKKLQVQQQTLPVRQMRIEQNNQVQIEVPKKSIGFSQKFIKDYFGVISYKKLVQQYPGLKQFEDCIICLESIKNGSKKQLRYCSVTPCFHIFHQKCLNSWLQKQQNCPFCREEFTIRLIQNKYPWLDLKQQRLNYPIEQQSQYIKNMKYSSNTDQSQDNQLNDSQQELVRKNRIIIEI